MEPGLTEGGIEEIRAADINKQQPATIRQGIMRMLACCYNIHKEEKRSLSCQAVGFDFFRSPSGPHASPPVLLKSGDDDPGDLPIVQEEVHPPSTVICLLDFIFFLKSS